MGAYEGEEGCLLETPVWVPDPLKRTKEDGDQKIHLRFYKNVTTNISDDFQCDLISRITQTCPTTQSHSPEPPAIPNSSRELGSVKPKAGSSKFKCAVSPHSTSERGRRGRGRLLGPGPSLPQLDSPLHLRGQSQECRDSDEVWVSHLLRKRDAGKKGTLFLIEIFLEIRPNFFLGAYRFVHLQL